MVELEILPFSKYDISSCACSSRYSISIFIENPISTYSKYPIICSRPIPYIEIESVVIGCTNIISICLYRITSYSIISVCIDSTRSGHKRSRISSVRMKISSCSCSDTSSIIRISIYICLYSVSINDVSITSIICSSYCVDSDSIGNVSIVCIRC